MTAVVWFRNDLRLADNPALYAACQQHEHVTGVFCITPGQWARHDLGDNKVHFIEASARALEVALAKRGIKLTFIKHEYFIDTPQALLTFCKKAKANAVYFNTEYELNEQRRDHAVIELLKGHGISSHTFHDQVIIPPGHLLNQQGRFFRVFTPFRRAWLRNVSQAMLKPLPAPKGKAAQASIAPIKTSPFPRSKSVCAARWPAGEVEATKRLARFIDASIQGYKASRDFPAQEGTSTLSPYLAVGSLSLRQCLWAALSANRGQLDGGHQGVSTWITELVWREFYRHLVVGFPDVCRHKPFKPETALVPWRRDTQSFQLWCDGSTGFPLVDAAMRQLNETGWMHNRLRMVVAMFLTKHLLIDWRWGERYFMQHLVDGDFAANNGGWQWSASTGADAAPYFRVFNPIRQSQRFDPEGAFIQQFLPQLSGMSAKAIHDPSALERSMRDYPMPCVDHSAAVARVKTVFQQLPALQESVN